MLLRRITKHVKDQNWFAVGIDFFIVVVGVFIGIQVSNWNADQQQSALGKAYLSRMTDDLVAMESYLDEKLSRSQANLDLAKKLLQAASAQGFQDDTLIAATEDYFTDGWVTPQFTIIDAVYQDMSATGNLNLLDDSLRQQITTYYARLDRVQEVMEVSRDWSLPIDSQIILEHDVYRWNRDFFYLLSADDEALKQKTILGARKELARLATLYIWIERDSLSQFEDSLHATRDLIVAIDG